MLPLLNLVKWKGSIHVTSCSMLVDFIQVHVRNVFLFCFGLGLAKQLFGDSIHCQRDGSSIDQVIVDMKCFINGTHSQVNGEKFYLDYYQWIPVILLLLALSFHMPCRIWHKWTGGFIQEVTTHLKDQAACDRVLHVVTQCRGNGLFWKTWMLEMLYSVHLLWHIWILNLVFHDVWSLSGWSPQKALAVLFPDMAHCHYDYFGGGGQTEAKFTCLLPLNSAYRKVFGVIHVLFILLAVLHVACFSYRAYLVIAHGRKRVDMWWCMTIAASRAQTWQVKTTLMDMCRDSVLCKDSKYISMNSLYKRPTEAIYASVDSVFTTADNKQEESNWPPPIPKRNPPPPPCYMTIV